MYIHNYLHKEVYQELGVAKHEFPSKQSACKGILNIYYIGSGCTLPMHAYNIIKVHTHVHPKGVVATSVFPPFI